MKSNKLVLFFLVTIIVVIAAYVAASKRAPQSSLEKTVLFPGLDRQINNVTKIVVSGQGKMVELVKDNGQWVLASSWHYPALVNKVRAAVINLSELKILDEKTDNPELYTRLGVEDPEQPDAASLLISLHDSNGNPLAELIVGQERLSSSSRPGLYVRKPGEHNALLVEGHLDLSASELDWFDRFLFDISASRIKSIDIIFPDGDTFGIFKEAKEQPDFKTTDTQAASESASKIIINRIATGFEEMRADGIMSAENFEFPEETVRTLASTFDGISIEARLAEIDGQTYGQFMVSGDPDFSGNTTNGQAETGLEAPSPANEIAALSRKLSGWVYLIPDFKYEALTTTPESLREAIPQPSEG